jgi:hypothetical protein
MLRVVKVVKLPILRVAKRGKLAMLRGSQAC